MTRGPAVALGTLLAVGCSPVAGETRMPNPALARETTEATQSCEIPPYGSDHLYEATLGKWEPASLGFRIHFVNAEDCGRPSSYDLALVDDSGRRYRFEPIGLEQATTRSGHLGATLVDGVVTGVFRAKVDGRTRSVTLEIRPKDDRACRPVDLKWTFSG
ncbi:MAG TPA: hypothetical protein VHL80_01060 [Polyangia bacterium]|nr:hypothetical protein [Polyangia bacterium]